MPFPWAAAIEAGGSLLGGFLSNRQSEKAFEANERWNEASHQLARESFDWQKNYIQNRVKDADKAGIHRLYALGTPGASASFTAGQHQTGSGLGTGIARAAQAIGSGLKKDPLGALQAKLLNAQIGETEARTGLIEQQIADSAMKRLEARTHGLGEDSIIPRHPLGQPYDISKGKGPRAYEMYTRPDGSKGTKFTPDMQMDEAGQILIGAQETGHYLPKWLARQIQGLLFEQFTWQPPSMYRSVK